MDLVNKKNQPALQEQIKVEEIALDGIRSSNNENTKDNIHQNKNLFDQFKKKQEINTTPSSSNQSFAFLKQFFAFFTFIFVIAMSLAFGILFFITQRDGDKNDYCENDSLKKWALATSILFFIISGLTFLLSITYLFGDKLKYSSCLKCLFGLVYFLSIYLISLVETGLFVCFIGLQVNNSSDCGTLYKVTLAYCIINFIMIGLVGLALIIWIILVIVRICQR
ncbi:hypothetical protein ABPG74_011988 [Tetrahymena malaccensis]